MSNTIDNRVVRAEFDNKEFSKGTQQTLKDIDSLKKGLNFDDSVKGLDNVSKATRGINLNPLAEGLDAVKYRFSTLGIVGMTIIQNLTNSMLQMARQGFAAFTEPIRTGLQEYETQINAIQTILANTSSKGTTLEQVNDALNQLNTYADKTIYNFTEMTRNIGTFTAAGVDLDTSVQAIKGIANLAAVSGSNSQQAATAMYQLSQALSSGTVKLMDWNSVVNAGMGGQVFQDALKETARLHGIAIDKMIKDEGSFRETLSEGWLSSEILTETLAKFTGDLTAAQLKEKGYTEEQIVAIEKLGQTANDAATKVKTFTQLKDTLAEALQSGWTQTWSLLLGDFEEAKSFFTGLSDFFGNMINESATARNNLLEAWKELGGRDELLAAFYNVMYLLKEIIPVVRNAFADIFPPTTAQQLLTLTQALQKFTDNVRLLIKDHMPEIQRIFKGFFALLDIGRMFVVSLLDEIFKFAPQFKMAGSSLFDFILKIADWIIELRNSIIEGKNFSIFWKKVFDILKPVAKVVGAIFVGIGAGIKSLANLDITPVKDYFSKITDSLKPLKKVTPVFSKATSVFGESFKKLEPILVRFGELALGALEKFIDWIGRAVDSIDVDKVLKVLNGGLFASILLAIRGFVSKSKEVVGGGLFASILVSVKKFIDEGGSVFTGVKDILGGVKDTLETYQKSLKSDILLKIAYAVGILALSLLVLSLVDPQRLAGATAAIGVMFVGLISGLDAFNKSAGGLKNMATAVAGLLGIAAAMLIISGALAILASLDIEKLLQGIGAITVLLLELFAFMKLATKAEGLNKLETGMLLLSSSLFILAKALALFGNMNLEQVGVGLLAMAGALTVITLTLNALPADLFKKAFALIIVSSALLILAYALKSFSGMSWEELGVGLAAMGGSLLILAVALNAMNSAIGGAGALLISAVAIGVLALSLLAIAKIPLEQIGIALLALIGVFTILGVAGSLLTPVVPVLLALAGAMFLFGLAALAMGVGILAFASGIGLLAAVGTAGIATVALAVTVLAKLIPTVAEGVAKGIVKIVEILAKSGPTLAESFITMLRVGITAITTVIPEIVQAGLELIVKFMTAIRDNIGEIVTLGYDIVINLLNAITEKGPELTQAGWDLIISFIDTMAESAEKNIPRLLESMSRLGTSIVTGVVNGIFASKAQLLSGISDLAKSAVDQFKASLGIHSPSSVFYDESGNIVNGLVNGLVYFGRRAVEATKDLARTTVGQFQTITSRITDSINSEMDFNPSITPVVDLSNVVKSSKDMSGIFGGSNLELGVAVSRSNSIANGLANQGLQPGNEKVTGGNVVNFEQNNYSPKALSPTEIYRQTRKQLFQSKGSVGVS